MKLPKIAESNEQILELSHINLSENVILTNTSGSTKYFIRFFASYFFFQYFQVISNVFKLLFD